MITANQKALEEVTKRLINNVKADFEKYGNLYDYEERILELRNGK
jgi:hypothetical protein